MENMKDPVFKATLKYANHPSNLAIKNTKKYYLLCQRSNYRENRKRYKNVDHQKGLTEQ